MQAKSDQQLLAEYAFNGLEAAFGELVARHTDLVYSAAWRQSGSTELAKEIAQTVFSDLARKAPALSSKLTRNEAIVAWLYRSTRYAALTQLRNDRRRAWRERQAMTQFEPGNDNAPEWNQLGAVLDEAMAELCDADRDALLLRFFKNRDFRGVGEALGVSDDAAQKRVSRALEKLRNHLTRRGVATTSAALSVALAANAVQVAPAGLASALASGSVLGAASGGGAALTFMKLMTMTKIKIGLISVVVLAGMAAPILIQHQNQAALSEQNQNLHQELNDLTEENSRLSNLVIGAQSPPSASQEQLSELLRLRNEVGMLRKQANDFGKVREENRRLQAALSKSKTESQSQDSDKWGEEQKLQGIAKMNDAKMLVLGLMMYAADNNQQVPTTLEQAGPYLNFSDPPLTQTNQFELVFQGDLSRIAAPATAFIIREHDPFRTPDGGWARTYGFADGHCEVRKTADGDYTSWESQHLPVLKSGENPAALK
jgi:RNA polymerase sigma factor (sigma-70 family)